MVPALSVKKMKQRKPSVPLGLGGRSMSPQLPTHCHTLHVQPEPPWHPACVLAVAEWCWHSTKASLASRLPVHWSNPPTQWPGGWGWARDAEGTQPGWLTPADQRDVPYHGTSCAAIKAWAKTRRGSGGEALVRKVWVFLRNCCACCYFTGKSWTSFAEEK